MNLNNPFFKKSRELITEISKFLDIVDDTSLIFQKGVRLYLDGEQNRFDDNFERILVLENEADSYQKDINYKLIKYMLIPEARADVLDLIESTDNVVDLFKKVLAQFSIERPEIPGFLRKDFILLVEQSINSVDVLVKGIRSYFEEIAMVNDYINKVHYYEHEADELEELLAKKVFSSTEFGEFSRKTHLRYFIGKIALISDVAEKVSDKLAVAVVKRSI